MDTNVLSELARPHADPAVVAWSNAQPMDQLYATTISEAEMRTGLALLPAGRRRDALAQAIEAAFRVLLGGRVLAFDRAAARAYPELAVARRRNGQTLHSPDVQIAAIAATRQSAVIATRNTRDFARLGIPLIDPWQFVPDAADDQ